MIMKHTLRFIYAIICCFYSAPLFANHIMGSDLGFKSLGGTQYRIVLKVYRSCRGDSFPISADSLLWYAGNNGTAQTTVQKLKLTRISIADVSKVCKNATAPCSPQNTTVSTIGIEEHVFVTDNRPGQIAFCITGAGQHLLRIELCLASMLP